MVKIDWPQKLFVEPNRTPQRRNDVVTLLVGDPNLDDFEDGDEVAVYILNEVKVVKKTQELIPKED